jgi:hypothetical protein
VKPQDGLEQEVARLPYPARPPHGKALEGFPRKDVQDDPGAAPSGRVAGRAGEDGRNREPEAGQNRVERRLPLEAAHPVADPPQDQVPDESVGVEDRDADRAGIGVVLEVPRPQDARAARARPQDQLPLEAGKSGLPGGDPLRESGCRHVHHLI